MDNNELTSEQENQISNLLKVIIEQSHISPKSKPLLVKIPFVVIESLNISFLEAKNLIKYKNYRIETKKKINCLI